jgi:molecular chaperone GrpE
LLEERTADLQRVQAEYANYRKRAERERLAAGDLAVGRALVEFLPILDDLDRAAAHGDLESGPLKAIADKLDAVFDKLGLEPFGSVGDPFDPALHEAVMHEEGGDVPEPTCTSVLRKGYRYRDRLLRPAMVGVTDPASHAQGEPEEAPSANGNHPSANKAEADATEQSNASETPASTANTTEDVAGNEGEPANRAE